MPDSEPGKQRAQLSQVGHVTVQRLGSWRAASNLNTAVASAEFLADLLMQDTAEFSSGSCWQVGQTDSSFLVICTSVLSQQPVLLIISSCFFYAGKSTPL